MEIIKIGNDSFKISLDESEMRKYELDKKGASSPSSYMKKLINKAKTDMGIDFGEDKMCAEIYVSKDGGCEIFVSRTQDKPKDIRGKRIKSIYRFSNINHLLFVCSRLKRVSYRENSELYYNRETKNYYLILEGINNKDLRYSFLSEFSEKVKYAMLPYICEYCEPISSNKSIDFLSKLL